MATYKEIKGVTVQTLDSDPVVNAGSWASGGAMNTAREVQSGAGTQTSAIAAGGNTPGNNYAIVEEYNGSAWSEVADLNSARNTAGGFGANAEATICYGGRDPGATRAYTESWNGSAWTEVNDMNQARFAFAGPGVGTSTSGMAVCGTPGDTLVETWDGTNWTEVAEVNTRRTQGGAAGAANTAAIAFGGYDDGASDYTANAEVWNGSAWTEVNNLNTKRSSNTGSGTSTAALCMSGRGPSPTAWARTENWNGTSWTEVADMATARYDGASGNSSPSTTSIMFAGKSYDGSTIFYALTEEFSFPPPTAAILTEGDLFLSGGTTLKGFGRAAGIPAGTWASGASMNTARGRSGFATSEAPGHIALVYGGSAPPNVANTEQYNGTSWTEKNDINTTRNGFGGGGVSTAAIYSGGEIPASPNNSAKSELWDGSSWTESTDINTARRGTTGFAGTNTAAILASGYTTTAVAITELWNGSSWTEVADQNAAKYGRCGTGTTTAGILAGGNNPTVLVETWDGSSWTEVGDLNTAREYGAISGSSGIAIVAGGYPSKTNVESWNGTSWSEINDIAQQRYQGMGNGSASFGLICGGDVPPGSALTEEFTADATLSTVTVS